MSVVSVDRVINSDLLESVREAAEVLIGRGVAVTQIDRGSKVSYKTGWCERSATPDEFTERDCIAIVCGPLSAPIGFSLVCVDQDSPEAIRQADDLLPPTGMVEGRKSKPRSHRYYLIPNDSIPSEFVSTASLAAPAAIAQRGHAGPRGAGFCYADSRKHGMDFKATGGQAVCPPSAHDSGEVREWEGGEPGEPATVDFSVLWDTVCRLAVASGLRIPGRGSRRASVERKEHKTSLGRSEPETAVEFKPVPDEWFELIRQAENGSVTIDGRTHPLDERVKRFAGWIDALPDDELPRSGHGGHDTLFRILSVGANDFLIRDPALLMAQGERINDRLRKLAATKPEFEPWDRADLEHKIDGALNDELDSDYPPGRKLNERGTVLRNYKIIQPKPEFQTAANGRSVRVSNLRKNNVCSFSLHAGERCLYSDDKNPWSEKGRNQLASRLGITPGQVLWIADAFKTSGVESMEFDPATLPADEQDAPTTGGVVVGLHVSEIATDALNAVGGNLRYAAGSLFAVVDDRVDTFSTTPALFGFLAGAIGGTAHPIDWREGAGLVTKDEFRTYIATKVERYSDVYKFPHYPPVPDLFYVCDIPPAGNGETLRQLVDFFSPDSATDRTLLTSLCVTALWGGPAGARPAFLIRGPENDPKGGRGVGKSTVAELLKEWCGGYVSFTSGGKVEDLRTRLLSDEARGKRIVLWDNIKAETVSNGDLEGLVTASVLSGRKLFHGEGSRPNLFTYVFTMNGGKLSKDFAQRCVTIRMKRPKDYSPTWQSTVEAFIGKHREELIADAVAVIDRAACMPADQSGSTRWSRWERGVLAGCVENASELASVCREILNRQDADDADGEKTAGIVGDIRQHIVKVLNGDPETGVYELDRETLSRIVRDYEDCKPSTAMSAYARHTAGVRQLVKRRGDNGYGYFWIGDEHPAASKLQDKNSSLGALRAAVDAGRKPACRPTVAVM